MENLLKLGEVAEMLRVAPMTVRKWVYKKMIPVVRVGYLYRFRQSDVESFIERNVRPAVGESNGRQ